MADLTPVTREEQFLDDIAKAIEGGGGGGGFTPTQAQLDAMNSGITAAKLTEDENNISSLQGHFTFSANSKMYYLQPEQPSNPSDGDIWIG